MRPIGIDLFAGAGGMSLGFEQAGFDVVAAVEIDPIHCAIHEYNFPNTKVLCRSVVGLTGAEIRLTAGLGDRSVDVVFGGAPCQGFSMIGQRAFDDPRNGLVRDFLRIVRELDANYFVFENVKGLTVGRHKAFLEELIAAAGEAGYDVRMKWQVLDAADYGTPQHRHRLFLLGAKKGLPIPSYPAQSTIPADKTSKAVADLPVGPNCNDALSDIPDADKYKSLLDTDEVEIKTWGELSDYAKEMRCLTNNAWHFGRVREWNAGSLTSSARTIHTEISKGRFAATTPGQVEPISRFFKLAPGGLSNTLRAGTDAARGAFTSPRPIHYKYARCVTVREMARLHGYPDWFRFHETKWHGARQIGNSVPPPLARAVAGQVLAAMGYEPVAPKGSFRMGDPRLLRMGMSEASEHFRVAAPIGKRDRKSGAKKRKQHEIEAERLQAIG
ncbi:DNA cytosine methyltransferase [Novosphingobium sp. RL4]|uniref:DNA cytosine methyltransferase n=1 Tax=Novosphingobium sp. RL4 TaxID=3109595 RepID=UPI002D77A5F0|nr:DNA cytosine methyltransferase [Novosphingobium sp. RL4]WRT93489.1 DNA cytosine methyltransferase [Novosphingobium sp. RL4]